MRSSNDINTNNNEDYDNVTASVKSSPTKTLESNSKQQNDSRASMKKISIQRDRQATLFNRATMEMHRKTRLTMAVGETQGSLEFVVPKNKLLSLRSPEDNGVKSCLYRRFEYLHPSRKEDDSTYLDAVQNGMRVKLIKALPKGYERGGWRCHALNGGKECMHPNKSDVKKCSKCNTSKPKLKPAFAHLRLLLPGMRQQRREYVRMIKEFDSELCRCELAEKEANAKVASFEDRLAQGICQAEDEEVELTMDVDLIQKGVWQRGNAKALLPMLFDRKLDLNTRLKSARAEVSIMIQCTYELAVVHVQKIIRRYLVRCKLDCIMQAKAFFARTCAALEIQRFARGKLAKNLLARLHQRRDCLMATKIQSIVRMHKAELIRKMLWDAYLLQLQHQKAIIIQSFVRVHAAQKKRKHLAELRMRYLEEQERDRVATTERNAATLIQSIYRRHLDKIKCANRRIEMACHSRLLMYLQRFAIDGCMWTFVKSINDDYHRLERTIKHVIHREEKMAKTFVEQVLKTRDKDHSSAWKEYHTLKEERTGSDDDEKRTDRKGLPRGNRDKCDKRQDRSRTMQIYKQGTPVSSSSRAVAKKNESSNRPRPRERRRYEGANIAKNRDVNIYRREARQLSILEDAKSRLRGQYLRFDIPNGLDDTTARFITTVAMHHHVTKADQSFDIHCSKSEYGDELIHALLEKGLVFIRQLLPMDNLHSILHDLKVDQDFILLSQALMSMLVNMDKGNYLERKCLIAKCNTFLNTQSRTDSTRDVATDENLDIVNLLGECGAAGCDEQFDDDVPCGLFETQNLTKRQTPSSSECKSSARMNKKRDHTSSWAVKFSQRVISENEINHPAYQRYRKGQLLANVDSFI